MILYGMFAILSQVHIVKNFQIVLLLYKLI